MVTENKQPPLKKLPGLRDANTGRNEGSLDEIKTVLETQERYLNIIDKMQKLCIKFGEKDTLENLRKSLVFAKLVFKMEAELKAINSKTDNDAVRKLLDAYELEAEAMDLLKSQKQVNDFFAINYTKNKKSRKKSGTGIKAKYQYLTDVAVLITKDYAKVYPEKLNKVECVGKVTAELKRKIIKHFMDENEQIKANLKDMLSEKTARKHILIAFEKLGFPSNRKINIK